MSVWLKLTVDDFVNVFDAWEKVVLWSRLCVAKDEFVSMFIWFCYVEWVIYEG